MSNQHSPVSLKSISIGRRDLLKMATGATIALPSFAATKLAGRSLANHFSGPLCIFSKHFPQLNWRQLAQTAKQLGFTGIDLTVRPNGHVLPERAAADLPQAVQAIRDVHLAVPMITTGLLTGLEPSARPILQTAGRLGIPYLKPGYYNYSFKDIRQELAQVGSSFRQLTTLAQEAGLQVGFHNHAGNVGGPIWDIATIIDKLDPKWVGYYFDIRHAVAEGGAAGWKIATKLIAPRLKMIAIKDFYWDRSPTKGWQQRNCPLGEGMVNWPEYFSLLAQANFHGPVSLHLEYDIPGATPAAREDNTLLAAQRDLAFLKARLQEAYK